MKTIRQIQDEKLFDYDQSYKIECGDDAQIDLEEMFNLQELNDKELKALKKSIQAELDANVQGVLDLALNIKNAKYNFVKSIKDQINQNRLKRLFSKIEKERRENI
jgi:hypothetical protein